MGKKRRKREKVARGAPTLPWESPHPARGHRRNPTTGKALAKKYPIASWGSDLMDFRLPGSFENGKNR